MAPNLIFRSDQASIGVTVTGVNLGNESWDVLEGGAQEVEVVMVLPGGMEPQVALGGIPKRSVLTVKKLWSESMINEFQLLDSVAGNAFTTVTYTVLGVNHKPAFPAYTYTGVLGTVTRPNYDAMKSEAAYLEISVGLNGSATGL